MADAPPRRRVLAVPRFEQPDDVTCGPTCLSQVLAWYGDPRPVQALAAQLTRHDDGGTQAVHLGLLALQLGYRARLYPFGVRVFDPSWWELEDDAIAARLRSRAGALAAGSERQTVEAWAEYLDAGGYLAFHEPSPTLLVRVLAQGRPLICGLNATWLYREPRTNPRTNADDDVHGHPVGHFVTLVGYTGSGLHVHVADPSVDAPFDAGGRADPNLGPDQRGRYPLPTQRLLHAMLLGDGTHDAVLLEVWPPPHAPRRAPESS